MPPGNVRAAASCALTAASCRLARLANVVMLPSGMIDDAETIESVPLLDVNVGRETSWKALEDPGVPFSGHTVATGTCTAVNEGEVGNAAVEDA